MKVSLTDELFKIEVLGEYTPITEGKIFKYFTRKAHTLPLEVDLDYPIYLSLDFNHDPMTAIAGQWIDGELLIIKEWFLRNSDSFQMGETLAKWISSLGNYPSGLLLHGDATGNQRTANSKNSNWEIINQSLKQFNPRRLYGKANPSVLDSINSVNCAFNTDRLFISGDCKELIKDLESLRYNNNGEIDKKQDLMRSHLGDTLRYICHHLLPYQQPIKFIQSAPTI